MTETIRWIAPRSTRKPIRWSSAFSRASAKASVEVMGQPAALKGLSPDDVYR